MSKLYEQYLIVKKTNPDSIALFKSGIFYIAISEDAKLLSEKLGLKLTNLNNEILKCGFPISRFSFYSHLLESLQLSYTVIESTSTTSASPMELNKVIHYILNLDFDTISYKDAFEILQRIHSMILKISNKEKENAGE